MNSHLNSLLQSARQRGDLLATSYENIFQTWQEGESSPMIEASLAELIEREAWEELNNRFFQRLAFGTGGLRGKTIGGIITSAEQGEASADQPPQYAAVGTNMMNDQNIIRVTKGLVAYVWQWNRAYRKQSAPGICLSYDTRYFSRYFAELAAEVIMAAGIEAHLFEGARSTPELSFAVRQTDSIAGINITASHNPPEYNGYKVYFADGGQVVEPHASAIIGMVDRVNDEEGLYQTVAPRQRGALNPLTSSLDKIYLSKLKNLLLEPELFQGGDPLKVVYTPLHGVGGTIGIPLLRELGVDLLPVEEQLIPDGGFSTVDSPNPEQPEALSMGIDLALKEGASLVLATDPDADRMGIAVSDGERGMKLLTGNQIGLLILWYRLHQLSKQGILTSKTASHMVVIKSIVTTQLQAKIATAFGVNCVETLTGFKYIGAKLQGYEDQLLTADPSLSLATYRQMSESERFSAQLRLGKYFIFGGEESYGYNIGDFVRDKDAHAAMLGICEAAAFAAREGITLLQLLDQIYATYQFYCEKGASVTLEGARGAEQMEELMRSYAQIDSWKEIGGRALIHLHDAAADPLIDSEAETLPPEKMLLLDFEENLRIIIRPSGTEPKIKFYLFFQKEVPTVLKEGLLERGEWNRPAWQAFQDEAHKELDQVWEEVKQDLDQRSAQR